MKTESFESLLRASFYCFSSEDWTAWYPKAAGLLEIDDATVRSFAVRRLCAAVFRAEGSSFDAPAAVRAGAKRQRGSWLIDFVERQDAKRQRASWLIDVVERAGQRHTDVLLALLDEFRWHGDSSPFPDILLPWLRDLRQRRPLNVPAERIDGAMLLIGGLDPWDGSLFPPILDHPSDYVRACAAHILPGTLMGEGWNYELGWFDPTIVAELTAKEIERPGIAGPFYSSCGFMSLNYDGLGFDPLDWMLDIIERRKSSEPADLPFKGIDSMAYRSAATRPESVRRLMAAGRIDLASMAATEFRDKLPAMVPVLLELGDHVDASIASAAQIHLAHYHGKLHRRAVRDRIRHLPNWRTGVEGFLIRYDATDRWVRRPKNRTDGAIFFPKDHTTFDDAEAWSIIEAALPTERRGDLVQHDLDAHDAAPRPGGWGQSVFRTYPSGAAVNLIAAHKGPGWRRLEVFADRLDGLRPMEWA